MGRTLAEDLAPIEEALLTMQEFYANMDFGNLVVATGE